MNNLTVTIALQELAQNVARSKHSLVTVLADAIQGGDITVAQAKVYLGMAGLTTTGVEGMALDIAEEQRRVG